MDNDQFLREFRAHMKAIGIHPNDEKVVKWVGILTHDETVKRVGEFAEAASMSKRAINRRLQKDGLPPAHQWIGIVRILRAIQYMQANPSATIEATARRFGFSSAASFSNHMKRLTSLRPPAARNLGWREAMRLWAINEGDFAL